LNSKLPTTKLSTHLHFNCLLYKFEWATFFRCTVLENPNTTDSHYTANT